MKPAPVIPLPGVSGDAFAAVMARLPVPADRPFVAAAVSGGGDSMALCLLLHDWARARGGRVLALTVDHGLRPGSAAEARKTAKTLAARGIAHRILRWEGKKPATHIQEEARRARYDLMCAACREAGCGILALGHNAQDQMETLWMRLAAGSGLDGLAGMAPARDADGVLVIRPLLSFTRAALRDTCRAYGAAWAEDPSNENESFLRVRLRGFEDMLAREGLTPARLTVTMQKLADARAALEEMARRALLACACDGVLDLGRWRGEPVEIRRRVLAALLRAAAPGDYPPRFDALERLRLALEGEGFRGQTLAGCHITPEGPDKARISRETA